jgi:DNA invertase Pin-like site-specific DNA recombinase
VTEAIAADPMKKALIQMQGIFAELEKSLIVKRLATARARKRLEKGKCEGQKGWNDTAPERKEEILNIIKRMRRKPRNQGKPSTYQSIAEFLNKEGLLTYSGKQWSAPAVQGFLKRA